jgi:large subunit ribosomal protein L10
MPLTRIQKETIVAELSELFATSKMTVAAQYTGLTVKNLQDLRKQASANGTKIKVVKNRLVGKALLANDKLKTTDVTALKQQLLYAFNATDEIAAAQVLNKFAKLNDELKFVGGISSDGKFVSAEDVTALAKLPSKEQLIATVINTLRSPMSNVMSGLGGKLPSIIKALEQKAAN